MTRQAKEVVQIEAARQQANADRALLARRKDRAERGKEKLPDPGRKTFTRDKQGASAKYREM